MAASSPSIGTDDMLEFCLMPWVAFGEEDVTATQVAVAAKVSSLLASANRFEVFDNFVSTLPDRVLKVFLGNEQFRRALIDLRRQQERYEEICELIKSGSFADGSDLLEVWDHAHYAMWERQYRKPLSSLIRFRIRKRNPPPPSICQDGRPTRKLNDNVRAVMSSWFQDHSGSPYPGYAERELMVNQTGLTHTQIRTWFANARRRRHLAQRRERKIARLTKMPARRKAKAGGRNQSSAKSELDPSGDKEKRGEEGLMVTDHQRHKQQLPPTAVCSVASPPAHLPPPLGIMNPTGLQGLMCMYNRLTAQGLSPPVIPSDPLGHPYSLLQPFPQHQRPQSQCSGYHLPHLQPYAKHPVNSPQMTGPLLRKTRDPSDLVSEQPLRGRDDEGPVLLFSPAPTRTAQKWDGNGMRMDKNESRENELHQEFAATTLSAQPRVQARQLDVMTSLPVSTSVKSIITRAAPKSETYSAAAQFPVLGQPTQTPAVAWVSGTPVTSPVAAKSVGAEMLGGTGGSAVTRDQCLAMWNTSPWFAAPNAFVSPTSFAETSQDAMEQSSCINQVGHEFQVGGFSLMSSTPTFVCGEFSIPHTPDTFLVFQPTASSGCLGQVGADMMMGNMHTSLLAQDFSTQSSGSPETEGHVDELAAQILLDLSTTKTCC